ncbi:WD40-repeat-containing domain protein [Suillus clintonianus]|uniref:WD40-repeat-containing domain protein n=1 Tax=Suillus clintonianus TaxID=1904413 RepID=UPI001B85F049|nr:WD40-repeat-containing domain protein [Suillus clintonianus]KAG2136417.1 WD40-repeat-containing domain protein [Suillus clintonianus]
MTMDFLKTELEILTDDDTTVELRKIIHYCNQRILAVRGLIRRVSFKKVTDAITRYRHKHHTLPTTQEGPRMLELGHRHEVAISVCSEYTERPNSMEALASEESETSRRSIARQRFKGAVRSVIMMQQQQAGQTPLYLRPFMPPRTPSFDRVSILIPKLKTLEPTHDLSVHTALVCHLQFSPNGKYLATSSWDRSSVIFRVGDSFQNQAVLVHVRGFIGQVAWSASGTILLTRLTRGIKVWTEEGLCKRTIDRPHSVSSIAWLPGSETQFFSVEGSDVFKLDVQGKVLDSYHFGRIQLHNVAVSPDGQRLLGVGPLLAAPNGLHPSRTTRVEKRIIVFNIETRAFENQTPVVNDVRDITMSKRGGNVLVSFERKTPPQLWKMELVRDARDHERPYAQVARLLLRHTYLPKAQVDFAGSSYFGGKDDQLVLCAGKAGDIHIWDRDSAALLHYIRPQTFGGVLTCVAWNHSTDEPFMFATGSHDGTVRIWATPAGDRSSDDASYFERRTDAGMTTVSDQYASSPILGPAPVPGSSCRRERAPTVRTTFSIGSTCSWHNHA